MLFFLPRPEVAIAEFQRVLKPKGRVVIALHERTLMSNYPEDTSLQPPIEHVIPEIADVLLPRKLPLMLQAHGFTDISVNAEMDRIYTKIGHFQPEHRNNLTEILSSGMHRLADTLGGQEAAETFLSDWLAYLDRVDTSSYTMLWVVQASAP